MALGLAEPEQPHSDQVVGHFKGVAGRGPCGETYEHNDCRCFK